MDALRLGTALAVLIAGRSANANPLVRWRSDITEAAYRFDVPEQWIDCVMQAESAGLTQRAGRPIRSRMGAIGLMQLMPATWQAMRQTYHLGPDPDEPRDNILAGVAYLRTMYDRFGFPGLFAAYNAGPARYAASLISRQRLPRETLAYLATVTGEPGSPTIPYRRQQRQTLFAVRHDDPDRDPPQMLRALASSLVVIRAIAP